MTTSSRDETLTGVSGWLRRVTWVRGTGQATERRELERFTAMQRSLHVTIDRMFVWLLAAQWLFAIVAASIMHARLGLALAGGGAINVLAVALISLRPGASLTRHTVAATQMIWSAMLVTIAASSG